MKKVKVIGAVKLDNNFSAAYYPIQHKIYYDRELNKFPKLKKAIIKHEMEHLTTPFNFIKHLKSEFIDYFRLSFMEEYYQYVEHQKKQRSDFKKYNGSKFIFLFEQFLYEMICAIYLTLLLPIRLGAKIYFKFRRG